MQGNFIRFIDYVDACPVEIPQKVKDQYIQNLSSGIQMQPLFVRIAATHSGRVTRNNGFYLPHKMQAGAASFTEIYPKPIQLHHDSLREPVGRVIKATYINTSKEQLGSSLVNESFNGQLTDLMDNKLSFEDAISFAQKYFIEDSTFIQNPHYEGLGYIELVASIADPDAIQKILDGRLLTGSTGAVTDAAVCSVCRQDWAGSDGKCDHRPGKVYDKVKCVLIAGNLWYDEYSFVNKPADSHSRIIEINMNGIQDFVQLDESQNNSIPEIIFSPIFDQKDSTKDECKDKKISYNIKNKEDNTMEKELTVEDFNKLTNEEVVQYFDALQAILVEREIECGCEKKEDHSEQVKQLEEEMAVLKTELEKKPTVSTDSSSEVSALQERVKTLQAEIKFLYNDMENLTNQLADSVASFRKAKSRHLVDLTVLSSKKLSAGDELSLALKDKTVEEMEQLLEDLQSKVDMQKIIDTLNSGLSNKPEEKVDDPTALQDQTSSSENQAPKIDESFRKIVRFEYMKVRQSMGEQTADKWLDNVCKQNDIQLSRKELLA
jgi:hypothetical protein